MNTIKAGEGVKLTGLNEDHRIPIYDGDGKAYYLLKSDLANIIDDVYPVANRFIRNSYNYTVGCLITTDIAINSANKVVIAQITINTYSALNYPHLITLQSYIGSSSISQTATKAVSNGVSKKVRIFNLNGYVGIWFELEAYNSVNAYASQALNQYTGRVYNNIISMSISEIPSEATDIREVISVVY